MDYLIEDKNNIFEEEIIDYEINKNSIYLTINRNINNLKNKWYCFVDDNEIIQYKVKYEYINKNNFKDREIIDIVKLSDKFNKNDCNDSLIIDLDGGNSEKKYDEKYAIGSVIELEIPTKEGYNFVGWEVLSGNADLENNILKFNGDATLVKEKWEPYSYYITFELNGGKLANENINPVFDEIIKISTPTKKGYTFVGWQITGDINEKIAKTGNYSNDVNLLINSEPVKNLYFKNLTSNNNGNIIFTAIWEDNIAPQIKITKNETKWTKDDVIIEFELCDYGSLIDSYLIDKDKNSGNWIKNELNKTVINDKFTISENETFYIIVKDAFGNISEKEITIDFIDKENPIINITNDGGIFKKEDNKNQEIKLNLSINDLGGSGIKKTSYSWSNKNNKIPQDWKDFQYSEEFKAELSSGNYYLWIKATDDAGNSDIKVSKKYTIYGWQSNEDDDWYYYDINGEKLYGWHELNGKPDLVDKYWYYFDENQEAKALVGWQEIDDNKYYFQIDSDAPGGVGARAIGWQEIDGTWYYLASDGKMLTEWQEYNGYWYYLGINGKMRTGWHSIGGYWFYFVPQDNYPGWPGPIGSMISNATITIDGTSYSFDSKGHCLNP